MLIPGTRLNSRQREQVLAAFVHRWTFENADRRYNGNCPACAQHFACGGQRHVVVNGQPVTWHEHHSPLTTDAEWLARYAFHFVADGSRLTSQHNYCVPISLAQHPERTTDHA